MTELVLDICTFECRSWLLSLQTSEHFDVSCLQEIHHSRRQIKYSKDKMWYLAKMVRPTNFSSFNILSTSNKLYLSTLVSYFSPLTSIKCLKQSLVSHRRRGEVPVDDSQLRGNLEIWGRLAAVIFFFLLCTVLWPTVAFSWVMLSVNHVM